MDEQDEVVSLSAFLLRCAGPDRERLAAVPGLEPALHEMLETAKAAWPQVRLGDEAFLGYLAERLSASSDPAVALAAVHASDLFLACACALGDAEALRAFDDRFLVPLTGYLQARAPSGTSADEVIQAVRSSILVRTGQGPPRIATYGGQGPLAGWLRIVAARTAGQMRRSLKEQPPFDSRRPLLVESPAPDPELAYLKTHYRVELETALRSTLAALAPRDRTILRLHFLEGLGAEAIATAYKVSRRTAERWLTQARERILDEIRRLLGERLQIATSQLDTLMGLVKSEIDVSVYELLGGRRDP